MTEPAQIATTTAPTTVDPAAVESAVRGSAGAGGQMTLGPGLLPDSALRSFVTRFPTGLTLDGSTTLTLDAEKRTLVVTGPFRGTWPWSTPKLAGITVTATIIGGDSPGGTLQFDADLARSDGGATKVSGSVTTDGDLSVYIDTITLTALAHDVAGATDFTLPGDVSEQTLTEVQGTIAVAGDGTRSVVVEAILNSHSTEIEVFGATVRDTRGGATPRNDFAIGLFLRKWELGGSLSPGAHWPPLATLSVDYAGLYLCSATPSLDEAKAVTESQLEGLLDEKTHRPRVGMTLIGELEVDTGPLSWLGSLTGLTRLDLLAARGPDGSTTLAASLHDIVNINGPKTFLFSDVTLTWTKTGTPQPAPGDSTPTSTTGPSAPTWSATASASGTLQVSDDQSLTFALTGQVSSAGHPSLSASVEDWVHPFGHEKLTITTLVLSIAKSDTGIDVTLAGAFRFTTRAQKAFTFTAGAEIKNFSAPSAVAFSLASDAPTTPLKISEVIEGITTIDVTTSTSAAATAVARIDSVLAISRLEFWSVSDDEAVIAGRTFSRGFGFAGGISLFGHALDLRVQVDAQKRVFSGTAELPAALRFGNVLTLARRGAGGTSISTTIAGPILAVSSFTDEKNPDYLHVAASVSLFDIFSVDVFGRVHPDGLAFSVALEAGATTGGAWTKQTVVVVVDRAKAAFRAGLSYDFRLDRTTIAAFEPFPGLRVGPITLPDLVVSAKLDVGADASAGTFHLGADITFTFMGRTLSGTVTTIARGLESVGARLSDLGAALLEWIVANVGDLLRAALHTAEDFVRWAVAQTSTITGAAVQVGRVLKDTYNRSVADAASLMHGAGFAAGQVGQALQGAYRQTAGEAARILKGVGHTAEQVGRVLLDTYRHTASEAAAALKAAQFTADGVARALDSVFTTGSAVALDLLTRAGFASSEVEKGMRTVFKWTDSLLAAAGQGVALFTTTVTPIVSHSNVDMIVLNMTAHRLKVVRRPTALLKARTFEHVKPIDDRIVGPGGADRVGVFEAAWTRWGYLYLLDLDNNVEYQLYIQESSFGKRYASFQYVNPDPAEDNHGAKAMPVGCADATYSTDGLPAAFVLHKLPAS